MKLLEVWTCQRAENLKKKSSKIPKNNYAATMVSAARRQIIGGGGGAPINKSRPRRPQIVGGGGAARPAHGSTPDLAQPLIQHCFLSKMVYLNVKYMIATRYYDVVNTGTVDQLVKC